MSPTGERSEEPMTSTPHRSGADEDKLTGEVGSAMAAALYRGKQANPTQHRIVELERENSRLQKLVAELLLKNQQLRKPEQEH
jgi:hypothetical protein